MNNSVDSILSYKMSNIDDPSLLANLKEVNESSESRIKCLEILRKELKNLQDIEPCLEENFLLRFLRVSKFDPSKAFQRLIKYYQQQDKILEALKKVSMSLQRARSINHAWVSPYRMKDNSVLIFALGGKVDYSKITFGERLYLDILAMNSAMENPVNQIAGLTIIFDYKGFNLRSFLAHTPNWNMTFVETFMNALTCRIKAVHIVNSPSLFLTIFTVMYPFLPKKIQDRVFIHPNDDFKSLHAAIPPEVLPEEYGGKLAFGACINALGNIEELDDRFHKTFAYGYLRTKASRQAFRPIRRKN